MSEQHPHDLHGHHHGESSSTTHRGLRARLARITRVLRAGHSHDHADVFETATATSNEGIHALVVSSGILVATAAVELGLLWLTHSVGVLSDAVHNAGDVLTAVPLGLALWLQRRAPTRRYTYGYGRAEDLAGVVVCLIIGASAVATAWIAVGRLLHPHHVTHLWLIAAAGCIGFLGNETVAMYRTRVGRHIGSAAMVADGLHARVDGITSLAVVGGAIGVACGWSGADAVVGLVISLVLLNVLRTAATSILRRLMDRVDPALLDSIESLLATVDGVQRVERVRLRWLGHRLEADATVVLDGSLSLAAAHDIAEEAHHRLLHEVPRLSFALIHCDPVTPTGQTPHDLTSHHFSPSTPASPPL